MEAPIHDRYSVVEGVRIHWAEMGLSDQRPPVVLLHGLGDSFLTWKRVASFLGTNRRVLMPDLAGHGLSERPNEGYTLNWHARVVARWIEERELGPVDIVGHSFGGGVAQMLLLESRARIRRLVLAASGGLGRDAGLWLRLASLPYVIEWFGQSFMGLGTRLALRRLRSSLSKEDFAELVAMNKRPGSARTLSRTARDVLNWRGQTRSISERIHEIDRLPPIAVIWGESDSMIPSTHGESLTQVMDGITFTTLSGCGHYLHQEDPVRFSQTVREFFDASCVPAARLR